MDQTKTRIGNTAEAKKKLIVVLAVAVVVAALAPLAYDAAVADRSTIDPSYAFDVSNKRYLAGYSDAIFEGEVEAIEEVVPPYTRYRVAVVESFKGQLPDSLVVVQHGYVAGNDSAVLSEQPLLEVGETYVLIANPALEGDTGDYTLIGAPLAAIQTTDSNRGEIVRDIREAIRNQQYPPGLAKKPSPAP